MRGKVEGVEGELLDRRVHRVEGMEEVRVGGDPVEGTEERVGEGPT